MRKLNYYPKKISLVLSVLLLFSCSDSSKSTIATGLPQDLKDEISKSSSQLGITSAENYVRQARLVYGELSGKWSSINPIDLKGFEETREKLQPLLFSAGNSIFSSTAPDKDKLSVKTDFEEMYYNSITQMMRGINNNISLYQAFFETNTQINTTEKTAFSDDELKNLIDTYQCTNILLEFVTQIPTVSEKTTNTNIAGTNFNGDKKTILQGIADQQTIILNGLIIFIAQKQITEKQSKNIYDVISKTLSNSLVLNTFSNFAISVFGADNVAFTKNQLTTDTTNYDISMVIKESDSSYRIISSKQGVVSNKLVNDSRGLSASEMQSNTNVVKVLN